MSEGQRVSRLSRHTRVAHLAAGLLLAEPIREQLLGPGVLHAGGWMGLLARLRVIWVLAASTVGEDERFWHPPSESCCIVQD